MGSTVLVFVPLMALWAAILVPMWLRNHDAAVESNGVVLRVRGGALVDDALFHVAVPARQWWEDIADT